MRAWCRKQTHRLPCAGTEKPARMGTPNVVALRRRRVSVSAEGELFLLMPLWLRFKQEENPSCSMDAHAKKQQRQGPVMRTLGICSALIAPSRIGPRLGRHMKGSLGERICDSQDGEGRVGLRARRKEAHRSSKGI